MSSEHSLPVKGFIETSFIDWKGSLSAVVFTGGCNFRCPFCHNRDLVEDHRELDEITVDDIRFALRRHRDWVDRLVISGGEPTVHKGLYSFVETIKSDGFLIKLDTNGSAPETIKELVGAGLVDYIAMDIKGPIDNYDRWCGTTVDEKKIAESVDFLLQGQVDYEFRMTVVPFLHKEHDVYTTADYIRGARRFFVQEFRPVNTLDPSFESIRPFSPDTMARIRLKAGEIMKTGERKQA